MIVKILLILADSLTWIKTIFNDLIFEFEKLSSTDFFNIFRSIWYYFRADGNWKYLLLIIIILILLIWFLNRKK